MQRHLVKHRDYAWSIKVRARKRQERMRTSKKMVRFEALEHANNINQTRRLKLQKRCILHWRRKN